MGVTKQACVSHHLAGQLAIGMADAHGFKRERAEGGKPFEVYVQNQYNERLLQCIDQNIL